MSQSLTRELQSLERQAREASPGYETQFLNRAANLCQEAGHVDRALIYYGRAIDAYLESGRFSAAEVVCRKILKMAPATVRARCTLSWLAIGKGHRTGTDEWRGRRRWRQAPELAGPLDRRRNAVFGRVFAETNGARRAQDVADH
jgi:hypothetical protein